MSTESIRQQIVEGVQQAAPAIREAIGSDNSIVPVIVVVVISGPIAIGREFEWEREVKA